MNELIVAQLIIDDDVIVIMSVIDYGKQTKKSECLKSIAFSFSTTLPAYII